MNFFSLCLNFPEVIFAITIQSNFIFTMRKKPSFAQVGICVFRYESIDYGEPLGEYVYEINGLGESRPDQTFWALLERTDSGDCFVPTGSDITRN